MRKYINVVTNDAQLQLAKIDRRQFEAFAGLERIPNIDRTIISRTLRLKELLGLHKHQNRDRVESYVDSVGNVLQVRIRCDDASSDISKRESRMDTVI